MSWLENFRQASFKEYPFFVRSHTTTEGRNVQQNEFVGKEKPFTEDINKKGGIHTFDAYLIDEDYFNERDSFRKILNEEGPGVLIHPYLGRLFVQSGEFAFTETVDEGRMVRFSLTFYETEEEKLPTSKEDVSASLTEASLEVNESALTDFEDGYSLEDQPGFLFDSAVNAFETASEKFNSTVEFISESAELVAELAYKQKEFITDLDQFIATPSFLVNYVSDSFDLLLKSPNPFSRLSAFKSMFDFGEENDSIPLPVYPSTTETRKVQIKNDDETKKVMQTIAVSNAAAQVTEVSFASRDDAITQKDELTDKIESLLSDETISDETFEKLSNLKAVIIRALPGDGSDLKNIINYETKNTTNSLLVSYDSSESIDTEQDLIDRNEIQEPGEIKTGLILEVLPE